LCFFHISESDLLAKFYMFNIKYEYLKKVNSVTKKALFLILCFSLLMISGSFVVNAQNNSVFQGQDDYLRYEILAPTEVRLNENFTVVFLIRPKYNVEVNFIRIIIYGTIDYNGEWDEWSDSWEDITMFSDADYRKEKAFKIASVDGEGHLYGIIMATYDYNGQTEIYDVGYFEITTIREGSYDELYASYKQYMESHSHSNTEYDILQSNYDSLQSQSGIDSGSSQYLIYLLLATTVLFVATTIYSARRKPKTG